MSNYEFNREYRKRMEELGLEPPSLEDRIRAFEKDLDTKEYVTLVNTKSGEKMAVPQSKRGNCQYARAKLAQLKPVISAFEDMVLDRSQCVSSRDITRDAYALFITFTHDHKSVSMDDSWTNFTSTVNRFKANMRKSLGSYVSFVVKEGTMSGWSAPHMIMILEQPIIARNIRGSWRADRTRDGKDLYRLFHDAWYAASSSPNIDVRAIVDGKVSVKDPKSGKVFEASPIRYILKYVTKAADIEGVRTPEGERIAKITHAQMKYFGLRDIIGNSFLTLLGLGKSDEACDLRQKYNELKLAKERLRALKAREKEIGGVFGYIFSREYAELCSLPERIEAIKAEIAEVVPPSDWKYVGARRFTPAYYGNMICWLESIDSENRILRDGKQQLRNFDHPDFIDTMLSEGIGAQF